MEKWGNRKGGRGGWGKGTKEQEWPWERESRSRPPSVEFMVFFWAHRDDPPAHPREEQPCFVYTFLYMQMRTLVDCRRCLSLRTDELLILFSAVGIPSPLLLSQSSANTQTRPRFLLSTRIWMNVYLFVSVVEQTHDIKSKSGSEYSNNSTPRILHEEDK